VSVVRPRGVQSHTGGGVGPAPIAPHDADHLRISFDFTTPSPLVLSVLAAGDTVIETEVVIDTAFDDPSSTLQVGTPADPGCLLSSAEIEPSAPANYGSDGNLHATTTTTVQLTLIPATSTAGAGYVQINIRRA